MLVLDFQPRVFLYAKTLVLISTYLRHDNDIFSLISW